MSAGKAIYGILAGNTDVTDLISTRIYPDMATQKAAYPFAVYTITSTQPSDSKDGASVLDDVEFTVMLYASTYAGVQDISEKVRTALDRYTGTVESVSVQSIRFLDTRSAQMEFDKHIFIVNQAYSARINRSR
jgi:hypothetical protein